MLKLTALTLIALTCSIGSAHAFRDNSDGYNGIYTGGVSSSKQQRYQSPYQNQYQPHQPQQYYNPQPQAEPSVSRIRLSGSGNGSARRAVIENDPVLRAHVNGRQVQTRDVLIGRVDLNGDGKDEIFVYNESPQYCNGNRCPFSIYQVVRNRPLRPLLQGYMTVSNIGVLNQGNRGWRDVVVYDQRGRQMTLTFNGNQYVQPRRGRGGWAHSR